VKVGNVEEGDAHEEAAAFPPHHSSVRFDLIGVVCFDDLPHLPLQVVIVQCEPSIGNAEEEGGRAELGDGWVLGSEADKDELNASCDQQYSCEGVCHVTVSVTPVPKGVAITSVTAWETGAQVFAAALDSVI